MKKDTNDKENGYTYDPRIALKGLMEVSAMTAGREVGDLSFIDKLPIERVKLVLENLQQAIKAAAGNTT